MGLDIYVQWDNMTEEEKQAQITGFVDAPEVGYLRASWPGYSFLKEVSEKMGVVLPLVGFHEYGNGSNGDHVEINDETLSQLREWRQQWRDAAQSPVPIGSEEEKEFIHRKLCNSAAMVDFVEAKYNEGKTGLIVYYG